MLKQFLVLKQLKGLKKQKLEKRLDREWTLYFLKSNFYKILKTNFEKKRLY